MFLTQSRQWFNVYDPMAFVVTEFSYGGTQTTVPFVVGPSLLEGKVQQVPNGLAITDTHVAGVHPYPGGKFTLSVILAQVRRQSHAKRVLQLVETLSTAFPAGAALDPYLKVAGAVMDGVESLFGMGDTSALAGHRWEYDDGTTPWLRPGFFALVNSDERTTETSSLGVVNGRLRIDATEESEPFRAADYVLYSLAALPRRTDISNLPFHRMLQTALREAASIEESGWKRAKALLVSAYQDMLTSPDLTWEQAQELSDTFKKKLVDAHEKAKGFATLGRPAADAPVRSTHSASEGDARQEALRGLDRLLEL